MEMEPRTVLLKSELLFKGIKIENIVDGPEQGHFLVQSIENDAIVDSVARKSGAGPAGGFFAQFRDQFQVNVPLQEKMVSRSDLFMNPPPPGGKFQVYKKNDEDVLEEYHRLVKIPTPSFYDDLYLEKELHGVGSGIAFNKIALVHGKNCVATTVNQKCMYWNHGHQCTFCAIEQSIQEGVVQEKTPGQLIAFTERARQENRVAHYTLTSGTQEGPDGGSGEYLPIVEALKDNFKYPIHVQVAPVRDMKYLDRLYYTGVDNVGIHLEVHPESLRKQVCPGKATISLGLFKKNWKYAVDLFGDNQVESYLLVGLGETRNQFEHAVELMLQHEVIPFIVPARPIKNTMLDENHLPSHEVLFEYYKHAGKRMHEQGMRPWKAVAGCVRCGACSAIKEATLAAEKFP
ncbi:radical SAM protein [Candidatus Bathyarchaeota archaeon]|nr:radical SAM protein [Candidatus Bathyarchaeota archaeon]